VQYLRGLSFFRQEKPIDARKAFDTANSINPSHAPTLNNLAVVYARIKQPAAALNYYDQAMLAGGADQTILDNVAEALGSAPDDIRKGPPYAKCLKRFGELEPILQKQMAEKSLYRWGGSWIDQTRLDELKAAEKDVREKLKSLAAENDKDRARIKEIDKEIGQNQRIMNDLMLNRYVLHDARGNPVAVPLPDEYYELDRHNSQLAAEEDTLKQSLQSLAQETQATQDQIPRPTFTGIQHLVGIEGMPSVGAPSTLSN
jgi:tetratricopeptide (TPR) repeat protein